MEPFSQIVLGLRTPMGAFNGSLASIPATELGALCIRSILEKTAIDGGLVDEVIMGNVIGAGLGQNPARQAAISGGLPHKVGATTVNKVCGSGLKAVMMADQAIRLGDARLVIAGGMENMSRSPYLLTRAREGYRLGNGELIDAMIHDGLLDPYGQQTMGVFGDRCASAHGITREAQDDFAIRSFVRARSAIADGVFAEEVVPVSVTTKGKSTVVAEDEGPSKFDEAKLRTLKPAFGVGDPTATITAGNASSISDGAAAILLASAEECEIRKLKPLARIVCCVTHSQKPDEFTTAPVYAIEKLLKKIYWTVPDVDLFEINEAFAVVALFAQRHLSIPSDKLNVFGGAVALGHPIGCSGARILVSLVHGLNRTKGDRGVASICIGGGEAIAIAIEMINSAR